MMPVDRDRRNVHEDVDERARDAQEPEDFMPVDDLPLPRVRQTHVRRKI